MYVCMYSALLLYLDYYWHVYICSFYLGPLTISVFIIVERYPKQLKDLLLLVTFLGQSIKGNSGLIGVHAIDWGFSRITRLSGTFDSLESRIVQLSPATQ